MAILTEFYGEETMQKYQDQLLIPAIQKKRKDLKLRPTQPAMVIFCHSGNFPHDFFSLDEEKVKNHLDPSSSFFAPWKIHILHEISLLHGKLTWISSPHSL